MTVVPSPSEQKAQVEAVGGELTAGEVYYVVANDWWRAWLDYTQGSGTDPGIIDNSSIVQDGHLKEDGVNEGTDFIIKHQRVWDLIFGWYSATDTVCGNVELNSKNELYVDLFPIRFTIFTVGPNDSTPVKCDCAPLILSRAVKMRDLLMHVGKHLQGTRAQGLLSATDKRLWVCEGGVLDFNILGEDVMDDEIRDALTGLGDWNMLFEVKEKNTNLWPYGKEKSTQVEVDDAYALSTISTLRRRAVSFVREEPQVGQRMDAKNKNDKRWYEAVVVKVEDREDRVAILVHFLSFGKDDDAWFFVDDDENISGPYTRVADWRSQLRKDEEVEVNRSTVKSTDLKLKGRWLVGKVKRFDRTRTVNGETQAKRKRIENEGGDQMNIYDEGMGPESTTPPTPPPNSTLGTHLHPGMVLLEIRTGTFLSQRKEVWVDLDSEELAQRYTHTVKPKPSYGPQGVQEPPIHSGVVGLRNLGNTCFMNSMLQCLSHTIPLTDYFIRGDYEADLNRKNPLGTGGKLAESFAVLISEIWSDKYSVFAPTDFKQQLGRAFTQFQGYQQQDSHEMFSLLVDGLHEDLNRVRKKPYTEAVEGKGRPDKVVADESWDVFKLRNDSIIVDEMMGLLRSHLTCPVCKEETVKYDAYSNWSIPVPKNKKRPLNLVLYRAVESGDSSGSLPRLERFVGDFSEDSDGGEVVEWLSGKTGLPKSELLLVDMHGNKKATHDFFYDPSQAMDYKGYFDGLKRWDEDKDMFAYHVPKIKLGGGVVPVAQDAMTDDLTPVESEDVIVEIRFVPAETTYKYLRLSDFIRLEGPVTTKQLHRLIWDRVRFMFKDDYSVPQGFLEQFGGHKHDGDTDVMDHHPRDTPSPREDDESCPYRIVDGGHVSGLVDCSDSETWEPKDAIQLEFSATGIQGLRMDTPVQLCSSRATIEEKDEAFALGEVSVHESFGVGRTRQGKRNGIDIYECFDRFREREQLGENDEWFCPKCKELVRAFKRMDLWSTPDTLVIHLKRFYYERSRFMRSWVDREKIKDLVTFPIDGLDLSTYILGDSKEDAIYDCYGVSNHIGGLGGGHYTAYIKSTDNNRWYCMDDSHTSEVDVAEVISPKAYVLFYKRRQSGQPQE